MKAVIVLSLFVLIAQASHFRYGTTSFTKSTSNPTQVSVTFNLAMRRSYTSSFSGPVGSSLGAPGSVYCGSSGASPNFYITNADVANDIVYATATQQWTLGTGTTYCYFYSSARISNLNNNANGAFQFGAYVTLTQAEVNSKVVNNSPVSGLLPIVYVPYNQIPYSYQIVASDPEGNALTFRQSTSSENQGNQPTGLSVSSSGLVTLSTVLAKGFWSTQQTITDSAGNSVSVDYLLYVAPVVNYCSGSCSTSQNSPQCASNSDCNNCGTCQAALPRIVLDDLNSGNRPRTNLPAVPASSTVTVNSGDTQVLSFVIDDQNLYTSTITTSTSGLPSYASSSAQAACDSSSSCSYVGDYSRPQLLQITLRPAQSDEGTSSTICVGAKSNGNSLANSQHCVTVTVPVRPRQVCGNGVVEGTEQCDDNGACCTSCQFASSSTVCRGSNGACDASEMCSGSSSSCPADSKVAAGTVCRGSNGVCDAAESCDGSSDACPADAKVSSTTTCRPAANKCDIAENCDGTSDSCPADALSNTAECFCGRQSTDPKAYPDYFCVPGNATNFFMCVYGAWAPQSREMSCASGTACGCPADGTECSCHATRSPCVWAGQSQNCN